MTALVERKTLHSTNPIESMFSTVRNCEWLGSVLLYCEQGFKRVKGYAAIKQVVAVIEAKQAEGRKRFFLKFGINQSLFHGSRKTRLALSHGASKLFFSPARGRHNQSLMKFAIFLTNRQDRLAASGGHLSVKGLNLIVA